MAALFPQLSLINAQGRGSLPLTLPGLSFPICIVGMTMLVLGVFGNLREMMHEKCVPWCQARRVLDTCQLLL